MDIFFFDYEMITSVMRATVQDVIRSRNNLVGYKNSVVRFISYDITILLINVEFSLIPFFTNDIHGFLEIIWFDIVKTSSEQWEQAHRISASVRFYLFEDKA